MGEIWGRHAGDIGEMQGINSELLTHLVRVRVRVRVRGRVRVRVRVRIRG